MTKQNYITKEGLEKLKGELKELKEVKRPEVIGRIQTARELGDLSENAEYQEAKDDQGFIEGRIIELEDLINNVAIITNNQSGTGVARIGCKIKVKFNDGEQEFTIVGSNEADPAEGKISNESPLGEALLGQRVGNEVEINAPKGKIKYKILEIS